MVEFRRRRGEGFEVFLRKFKRALFRSQKLTQVRKKNYLRPKKNKSQQKEYALISQKLRAEKEYLTKTGKLKEEPRGRWR